MQLSKKLQNNKEKLEKYLANLGFASRRNVNEFLKTQQVALNSKKVKKDTPLDVYNFLNQKKDDTKYFISFPKKLDKENYKRDLEVLLSKGFTRVILDSEFYTIESLLNSKKKTSQINVVIDRGIIVRNDEDFRFKVIDVCKEAFFEGSGTIYVNALNEKVMFSNLFELDGYEVYRTIGKPVQFQ